MSEFVHFALEDDSNIFVQVCPDFSAKLVAILSLSLDFLQLMSQFGDLHIWILKFYWLHWA